MEARYTKWVAVRNTFIIFLLSGFWHGANWTFVLWGAYHALLFVPLLLLNRNRRYRDTVATITMPDGTIKVKWLPSLKEAGQMLVTFALAVVGWIIFRANGMESLTTWLAGICDTSLLTTPWLMTRDYYIPLAIAILVLLIVEWINRANEHTFVVRSIKYKWLRIIIYYALIIAILCNSGQEQTFIYFQF